MTPPPPPAPLPQVVWWWWGGWGREGSGGSESIKGELSTYRRAGVHHSQETRGTHKDTQSEGGKKNKEESRERKRFNSRNTEHYYKKRGTSGTLAVRDDTLWPSRRR